MESPISVVAMWVPSMKSVRAAPGRLLDQPLQLRRRELHVRLAAEIAGHRGVGIDDRPGLALAAPWRGRRSSAAVTMSQPSSSRAPPAAMRTAWMSSGFCGDAHMGEDGAALLRQAGHVQRGAALALQMGRHAQQRADGDDAGAADAGDEDAVGLVERRQLRLRQRGELRRAPPAALRFRSLPPCTVTKLGQKPLRQEKSLLQEDWSIARLRPNSVSTGTTDRQLDCTPQSPQPSQTSSLMTTRLSGSGIRPRLRRRRFSAAQVWS